MSPLFAPAFAWMNSGRSFAPAAFMADAVSEIYCKVRE